MEPTDDRSSSQVTISTDGSFDTKFYSLTLEQAREKLDAAGVPRNDASIARFCRTKKLKGVLASTSNTKKYFINDESLQALITELRKKKKLDNSDIYHHEPSHVTSGGDERELVNKNQDNHEVSQPVITHDHASQKTAKTKDMQQPVATRDDALIQIITKQYEEIIRGKDEIIKAKDDRIQDKDAMMTIVVTQLATKDDQIKQLTDNMLAESKQGRGLASGVGALLQKYLLGPKKDDLMDQPPLSS
jgi:hypothetical protein